MRENHGFATSRVGTAITVAEAPAAAIPMSQRRGSTVASNAHLVRSGDESERELLTGSTVAADAMLSSTWGTWSWHGRCGAEVTSFNRRNIRHTVVGMGMAVLATAEGLVLWVVVVAGLTLLFVWLRRYDNRSDHSDDEQ